jgi:hypothetical protein
MRSGHERNAVARQHSVDKGRVSTVVGPKGKGKREKGGGREKVGYSAAGPRGHP